MKEKQFWNPWKISYKMYKVFFPFSIENEKKWTPSLAPLPLFPPFWGGGGSSAASPLEIWDVMPPYLKIIFEQKTEIW